MAWSYVVTESYDALTTEQMQANAVEFYNYFAGQMTLEAICGILGNIQRESQLNPGQQEGGYGGSPSHGYGLIQWTPESSVYPNPLLQWASYYGYDWYDGAIQCEYINAEGYYTDPTPGSVFEKVWYTTSTYGYTWDEYKALTDIDTATAAYMYERERAGVSALPERIQAAHDWFTYLSGIITPFTPRLTLPHPAPSPWYTPPDNWFAANGYAPDYGITYPNGNCTWYAYGRYAEIRQAFANLPLGDAGTWYENATSFNRGDFSAGAEPQLGAIVCFKSASGVYPGHLTVVEQINSDGSIVVSQSGYSSYGGNTYFWTATVRREDQYRESWYTQNGLDYYCQGFIYNTISPVPPTPPTPYTRKKMPLWMMLRYHF